MQVAIITEIPGWHGEQLHKALIAQGIITTFISLRDCYFDTQSCCGVVLPHFTKQLPDGVLVRNIAAGSFEQVTLRLSLLHALHECGITVYNGARAIERTVDKAMTSFLLKRAEIPTPTTWVCESREHANSLLQAAFARSEKVVIKPLFGSQGQGLLQLKPGDNLPDSLQFNQVYYLQTFMNKFVETNDNKLYFDWRVFVIGGHAEAAMKRVSHQWVTNYAQGAYCEAVQLTPHFRQLAEGAAQAVGVDYAGIDIVQGSDGQYYVLEVNGIPAWQGLQSVCSQNLAHCIVADFIKKIQ